jgi:hypothetical protein
VEEPADVLVARDEVDRQRALLSGATAARTYRT